MQRDWLTTLPYTTTMYPAIFLRPLSSTRSYALPTYLPFYLFLLRCYTFKHTHTYMCELGTTRVTHKHSFLSRFLFIDPLPPTPSFNLTLFIRLRPSVNSCLSFSPPPPPPPYLFFIFSQRLSKRLFRVMHRFLATSLLPRATHDPIARLPPSFPLGLPRALFSAAFTLLD